VYIIFLAKNGCAAFGRLFHQTHQVTLAEKKTGNLSKAPPSKVSSFLSCHRNENKWRPNSWRLETKQNKTKWRRIKKFDFGAGLPDGLFSNQKSKFG
jgi:hypothetical protein